MLNLIDTRILGIELPSAIVAAIDRKIEQYYISEEYKFRVAREIRESERKKIEAEGISEFQRIVSQGISESYLRWRGIEATLQLAQSSNSKIVIVGSGKDGLPIILGNVDAEEPASAMLHLMNGIGQVWGSVRDPIPGARDDNGQLDRHDHIDRHDDYRPRNHLNQSVIAMTAMRFSSSLSPGQSSSSLTGMMTIERIMPTPRAYVQPRAGLGAAETNRQYGAAISMR